MGGLKCQTTERANLIRRPHRMARLYLRLDLSTAACSTRARSHSTRLTGDRTCVILSFAATSLRRLGAAVVFSRAAAMAIPTASSCVTSKASLPPRSRMLITLHSRYFSCCSSCPHSYFLRASDSSCRGTSRSSGWDSPCSCFSCALIARATSTLFRPSCACLALLRILQQHGMSVDISF